MEFLAKRLRTAFCTGSKVVDKVRAKHSILSLFLLVIYCGGGMVMGNSDWDDGNRIKRNNLSRIMRSFFGSLAKVG